VKTTPPPTPDASASRVRSPCRPMDGSPRTARADSLMLPRGGRYVVEGSPEAAKLDLDFDLVLDKDLAVNKYPSVRGRGRDSWWRELCCIPVRAWPILIPLSPWQAKLDKARAADHTSLCAQFATPEIWKQVDRAALASCHCRLEMVTGGWRAQYESKVSTGPAKWTLARAINTGVMCAPTRPRAWLGPTPTVPRTTPQRRR
jgi:hypothetical protein